MDEIPSTATLRRWFDDAKIPRFKTNPAAARGSGKVYYSVSAIEKFLRTKMLPGRLPSGDLPLDASQNRPH